MIRWRATKDCSICEGTGTIIANERIIKGEYWCSWIDCNCVLKNWNEDMKNQQEQQKVLDKPNQIS